MGTAATARTLLRRRRDCSCSPAPLPCARATASTEGAFDVVCCCFWWGGGAGRTKRKCKASLFLSFSHLASFSSLSLFLSYFYLLPPPSQKPQNLHLHLLPHSRVVRLDGYTRCPEALGAAVESAARSLRGGVVGAARRPPPRGSHLSTGLLELEVALPALHGVPPALDAFVAAISDSGRGLFGGGGGGASRPRRTSSRGSASLGSWAAGIEEKLFLIRACAINCILLLVYFGVEGTTTATTRKNDEHLFYK